MTTNRGLFAYPSKAAFNRVIPKTRIHAHGKPSRRVRDLLTAEVAQIVWKYKLAPETINLPARPAVPEIQIFSVALKASPAPGTDPPEVSEDVLRCIDKAIGFPILFEVTAGDRVQTIAAYKRPSDAAPSNASKWVVGDYFGTGWLPADSTRSPLPVALDLARLYEQMLRALMPTPAHEGESLQAQAERQSRLRRMERECRKLEARMHREKQFNRKVELNHEIRRLQVQLEELL